MALILLLWLEFRTPASTFFRSSTKASAQTAPAVSSRTADGAVGCLGYIEPQDGILRVTASPIEGRSQRVLDLKVKEGDTVKAAQLLAIMDGQSQLQAGVHLAEARVELAQARLRQVKAGASASDIAAQSAVVKQLQAALDNARTEYHRGETLHEHTDISTAELDSRRLNVQTSERRLEEATERLKSLSEVRPADIDVAQSDLSVAQAEAERAHIQLQSAMVYAPVAGRVLRIHAFAGEEPGPQGLLDLGKSEPMYVLAEVYETEIAAVHRDQQATISSDLFPGSITGVVETVGATIDKADVLPLDPVTFADARVFKVWIRLNDSSRVASLIHGKVNVVIHP